MAKDLKIKVTETEEEFKDLYNKKHTDLEMLVIILAVCILMSNGQIVRVFSLPKKSLILVIIIFILGMISVVLYIRHFLLKSFKDGMEERKELFNYTITFTDENLIIDRGRLISVKYEDIKIKESKKCYFVSYRVDNKKQIAMLNKANYTEEEREIIEKYLKKQ